MEKLWASFKLKPSTYQSRFHRFVAEKIVNRFLQFHKPEDEKRSIMVIEPEHRQDWLNMHHEDAFELLKPMGAGYVAEHRPKPKKTLKTAQMDVFNG